MIFRGDLLSSFYCYLSFFTLFFRGVEYCFPYFSEILSFDCCLLIKLSIEDLLFFDLISHLDTETEQSSYFSRDTAEF